MSVKKIGHHNGLIIILIFSFVLLLVLQESPARSRVNSNEDYAGYRARKSGHLVTLMGSQDFQDLLQEARRLYNEMDYPGAIKKLMAAEGSAKTCMQKADLYFYLSLAFYATLSERDKSDLLGAIEKIFVFDYQREPDPDLCPSGYIEIFNELKESYGAIEILSEPPGADVYISRNLAGKTPLTIGAKAGRIDVLVKKGKVEKQDQLEVTAGEVMFSPIYELAGKKGKFPIAIVLGGVAVAGGAAAFLLKGGGNGGGVTTGSIQVSSSPSGAKIYLDGTDTGKVTDSTLTNVSAGSHTVKLTKDGYSDKEQSVTVTAGQTATVDLTLTKDTITVTQPASGTTWTKGSSVEITWQVSAGSAVQSQRLMVGPVGLGLRDEHRFNAQFLRSSRDITNLRRTDSDDMASAGGKKGLDRIDRIRGRQGTYGRPEVSASRYPWLISGRSFPFSSNAVTNPRHGQQTGDMASALVISKVKIELYKGGIRAETIVAETENHGSHAWQVTSSLANGSDYKVRVTCSTDSSVYGESVDFSIGTTKYEYVSKWGRFGNGNSEFDEPKGVAIDDASCVYVCDSMNYRTLKFSSTGIFKAKFGESINHVPEDIAIDADGYIYIADVGQDRVLKFGPDGTLAKSWGGTGSGAGKLHAPSGIDVDRFGNVYIIERENFRVQKFNSNGTYLDKWGEKGTGDGQFNNARGIAVDSSGNVYVADGSNSRIQKFSSNGTFITKWGTPGSGDSEFINPRAIAVDSSGFIYVADTQNNRIQKFTPNGTFLTKWGTKGTGDGQFDYPCGLAVDRAGYVYVVDTMNNRVQKFRKVG